MNIEILNFNIFLISIIVTVAATEQLPSSIRHPFVAHTRFRFRFLNVSTFLHLILIIPTLSTASGVDRSVCDDDRPVPSRTCLAHFLPHHLLLFVYKRHPHSIVVVSTSLNTLHVLLLSSVLFPLFLSSLHLSPPLAPLTPFTLHHHLGAATHVCRYSSYL